MMTTPILSNFHQFGKSCLFLTFLLRGCLLIAQTDSVSLYLQESATFSRQNKLKESFAAADKALTLARSNNTASQIGEAAKNMGSLYRLMDKSEKAEEMFFLATISFEKTTLHERYARSLAELARVKQGNRNYAEAIELYYRALSVYHQKLSAAEAVQFLDLKAFIFERMAVLMSAQKDYIKAEEYGLEAYALYEKLGDKGRWEICATTLGNVYYWLKNYDKAGFYYQKAYELAKNINRNTGRTLNNLGIIAAKKGDSTQAIAHYEAAIKQYKIMKLPNMIAQTQINVANLYNEKGDFPKAIQWATLGVKTIEELQSETGLADGYESLLTAYIKTGQLENALEAQRRFVQLKDSLAANARKKEILLSQTKFDTERKNNEIKLLNKENQVRSLELERKNLDLINQKLLIEKKQSTLLLLQQEKKLQESKLTSTQSELEKEKQISENTTTQLALNQRDRQIERQQLQLESKNNSILKGVIGSLILLAIGIGWFIWFYEKNRREREIWQQQKITAETMLNFQSSELKALRSQINPHFIFNCLNAVKSLVLQEQNTEASNYITKFARLVRLVLENSRSEWISLEQELETLTLYLEIEQMRFNNRFKFWINLENSLDTEGVKLPPMLIQPYVENAIWHGLMHKEGIGNVTISVSKKIDNLLEINVIDDGIGRQNALALKSKTATQRKSLGMTISADRLHIINQIYKVNAQVFIHDLTDPTTQQATGTQVQLLLSV
ncbi:MAG: tetratricopeptide repeat protein [Saprospiraceae bacterium]|nr:tetratricopeptide repeat protein [Saprospiraceae bacterium]